ncbi:MAG: hypothetical protein ACTSO3_15960, partial [Candidatus Heimdallarchaeaceae archaeon]
MSDETFIVKSWPIHEFGNIEKDEDGVEKGIFYGSMATEDKDLEADILAPTAFDKSIALFKSKNKPIPLYYNHMMSELPVGVLPINDVHKEGK